MRIIQSRSWMLLLYNVLSTHNRKRTWRFQWQSQFGNQFVRLHPSKPEDLFNIRRIRPSDGWSMVMAPKIISPSLSPQSWPLPPTSRPPPCSWRPSVSSRPPSRPCWAARSLPQSTARCTPWWWWPRGWQWQWQRWQTLTIQRAQTSNMV